MTILTRKSKIAIAAVIFSLVLFFSLGATLVWAQSYEGRIGPRTFIGTVDVGGLDREEARTRVQESADALLTDGVDVTFEGKTFRMPLSVVIGSDAVESASFDVERTIARAYAASHGRDGVGDALAMLRQALGHAVRVPASVVLDENAASDAVRGLLPEREVPAKDAAFVTTRAGNDWEVRVENGTEGVELAFDAFVRTLEARLATFDRRPIALTAERREPAVSAETARASIDEATRALERAPYALSYAGKNMEPTSLELSPEALAPMLVPTGDEAAPVGVDANALDAFLAEPAKTIEHDARDARFVFENGRVTEFTGSSAGVAIDRDALRARLSQAMLGTDTPVPPVEIPTVSIEPAITTAEVNDLGITEPLGVGTSSYRGSPANRLKNIRNGVSLLNGRLIAPGETFSLLGALKPFETSNGYLPELVIKGDKIIPEIGGGLCQIGTTTFRAAMNSGLAIAQRSNHSLVVSYYNDPSNGNPGTDATIYDPAPDFQFTNDTGHDILFQAEMLEEEQQLRFTFWGTSDGRKGSYSPPVVERWIGVGAAVMTETLDLPVGEKKCQAAHVGADTTFTYAVVRTDGTTSEQVFASHYRPLPELCLVGVEKLSTQEDLPPGTDSVSSSQTSDAPVDDEADRTDLQTNTE